MPFALLAAALEAGRTHEAAAQAVPPFGGYGVVFWLLLALLAAASSVIVERALLYRREQIDIVQFLAGVRTVLRRDNLLEALSICDATPGPAARLVKAALQAREGGRERVREAIADSLELEIPRLEERLTFLAAATQLGPLLGICGSLLGMAGVFRSLGRPYLPAGASGYAAPGEIFDGVLQSLYAAALGTLVAAVCYAAHQYLASRVDALERDLRRAAGEAAKLATGDNAPATEVRP